MGLIYKISNSVNNKVYVGQTIFTLKKRWKEHVGCVLTDCKYTKRRYHLQRAMLKYGIDKFKIELIEQCDDSILDEREIYWISKYNSYKNGYNENTGGRNAVKYDHDYIHQLFVEGFTQKEIKKKVGISECALIKVLKKYGDYETLAPIRSAEAHRKNKSRKAIEMFSLNGKYIKTYDSIAAASRETLISSTAISACANGKTPYAGEYQWKFVNNMKEIKPIEKTRIHHYGIDQMNDDGSIINHFDSIKDASAITGINARSIQSAASDDVRYKHAGSYVWKWTQRDSKPEEFAEYNAYCEECKLQAKEEL